MLQKNTKINYNKHISAHNYKSTDGIGYHVNYFIPINPAKQVCLFEKNIRYQTTIKYV